MTGAYRRLLLPVYLPSLLMSVSHDALLVLLPLYVLDSGLGAAFAAFVIGLRGLGILAFDVPAGKLVMRFGERAVLLIGLAAVIAGFVILAASRTAIPIAIAALLFGVGFAAWMLGRQSYIAAICAPQETGRAITVMAGIQRVGGFAGPLLGGMVAQFAGYTAAFIGCAVFAVLAGLFVHRHAELVATEAAEPGRETSTLAILHEHRRVFATAGFAAMVLQLMRATRQLLIPLFGQSVGLDVALIGAIYSLSAAIDMCLFYPVGLLVDRRGRRWSAIPAMVLFAIGLALLPLVDNPRTLAGVALLLGFANGCGTGIVMIMGADLSRRAAHRGAFLSVWRLMADTGTSGAPLLTSAVINIAGLATASAVVAGLGFLGAAVMILLVAETHRPH
ncbi:MAG TPA: MFS transporter [Gammaproteobacteria bacterium]|nr:MFS transporter [Gammaproteobacteria bacterium]